MYNRFKNQADTESYVVVIYGARKDASRPKPSLDIQATIVGVIKGSKEVGDKIAFNRVSESEYEINEYLGAMYIIQYIKVPANSGSPVAGQFVVPPQYPGGFVRCSAGLFKLVNESNIKALPLSVQ